MENYYLLIGKVVFLIIGLLLMNFWGKNVIPTFISGLLFIITISNYRLTIPEEEGKLLFNILMWILCTISLIFLLFVSEDKTELLSILKKKSIYFSIVCCIVLSIISFFINKKSMSDITVKHAYNLFLTMAILPIFYELFIHEVIWKMIMKSEKRSYKVFISILTTIILIFTSCADWSFAPLMWITASATLIGAGVLRIYFKRDSDFWMCVLLRGLFYFVMFSFVKY